MNDRPLAQTFGGAILIAVIAGVGVMLIDRATKTKPEIPPHAVVGKSDPLAHPMQSNRTQPQQAPLVIHSPSPPPNVTGANARPETRKMGTFPTSKQNAEDCARYYAEHGLPRHGCSIPEDFRTARPELAKAKECAWIFATRPSWAADCTSSPPVGQEEDLGKALGCVAYLTTYYQSAPGCLPVVTKEEYIASIKQKAQKMLEGLGVSRLSPVRPPKGDTTATATK